MINNVKVITGKIGSGKTTRFNRNISNMRGKKAIIINSEGESESVMKEINGASFSSDNLNIDDIKNLVDKYGIISIRNGEDTLVSEIIELFIDMRDEYFLDVALFVDDVGYDDIDLESVLCLKDNFKKLLFVVCDVRLKELEDLKSTFAYIKSIGFDEKNPVTFSDQLIKIDNSIHKLIKIVEITSVLLMLILFSIK